MPVQVLLKKAGKKIAGRFAVIETESVGLFSGIMSHKKGGFRGCGKKQVFMANAARVTADDPAKETKRR